MRRDNNLRCRNWLLFLLVIFLWGSNWSVMKLGLRFVSPSNFLLQRLLLSAAVLSPILFVSLEKIPRKSSVICRLLLLSLIFASSILATLTGLVEEGSGLGAVLTYTQPLFVFCLAVPFLRERVTPIRLFGAIVGFVGIITLFLGSLSSFSVDSTIILLLGALLWAVALVYYKRSLIHVDPLVTNFFQLSLGAIPLCMFSLFADGFVFPGDAAYVWIILYTSVGAFTIGSTVWLFIVKEEDVTVVAGSSFLVPLVALLFGWIFLGETVRIESMIGSALILAGVYLVNTKSL